MSDQVDKKMDDLDTDVLLMSKIRHLMGGTTEMRRQLQYLPKETGETQSEYSARVARSYLFNGLKKTVNDNADKVFSKDLVLSDAPEAISGTKDAEDRTLEAGWIENIDMAGRSLNVFAHEALKDSLQVGINFFIVDMPRALSSEDGATRANEMTPGFRPFMSLIKFEDVLGWKTEDRAGVLTLKQFRFMEHVTEDDPDDEFNDKKVIQIKVYDRDEQDNVSIRIYRKPKDDGSFALTETVNISLNEIPVVANYSNRTGYFRGSPPLDDLADVNIAHWQSQSDQKNILHVVRVALLFGKGFELDEDGNFAATVGRLTLTNNEGADLKWVEHSGAGIDAGDKDLKNMEFQMQAYGLSLLIPKTSGATATGENIDNANSHSSLGMMASAEEQALEKALMFMAQFAEPSAESGGTVTLNKEFGFSLNAVDSQVLIALNASGLLRGEVVLKELQRRGVLSDDIDVEAEAELADAMDDIDIPEGQDDDLPPVGTDDDDKAALDNVFTGFADRLRSSNG